MARPTSHNRDGAGGEARRLRVAYLIDSPAFSGIQRHVLGLMDGLDRERFEPTLFCNPRDDTRPFLEEAAALGVEVRRMPRAGAAVRFLEGQGIDVIHFHAGDLAAVAPAMAAAAWLEIPRRILTLNNPSAIETRSGLMGSLHRRALLSAHAVVAVSESVRRSWVNELGLPSERIAVIPYGVAAAPAPTAAESAALRRGLGLPPEARVVGTVARLAPEKALHILLEAMAAVRAAAPEARCLLVGDGPCRDDLHRLAARLELEGAVTFGGFRPDAAALTSLFDVAVLPSASEGLPLFILEAMAAGKPVVATRVGGIPEEVVEGETGLLVDPQDPPGLAAAILRLLQDPPLASRLGQAGRRRAQRCFPLEAMLRRTLALYDGFQRGPGSGDQGARHTTEARRH